jgi:hypothetical protein
MAKKPEMVKVQLGGDPYDAELYCPHCGTQILEPGGEGIGECPHLIHADIGLDTDEEFQANDLAFVFFEPAPASQEHYFVFREVCGEDSEDDE